MKVKSYTDINQSKKLVEILPIESADMCYSNISEYPELITKEQITHAKVLYGSFDIKYFNVTDDTPCWSLAALLDIIPAGTVLLHDINGLGYKCIRNIDTNWHDNPVDACYEMILKSHEFKKK